MTSRTDRNALVFILDAKNTEIKSLSEKLKRAEGQHDALKKDLEQETSKAEEA